MVPMYATYVPEMCDTSMHDVYACYMYAGSSSGTGRVDLVVNRLGKYQQLIRKTHFLSLFSVVDFSLEALAVSGLNPQHSNTITSLGPEVLDIQEQSWQ